MSCGDGSDDPVASRRKRRTPGKPEPLDTDLPDGERQQTLPEAMDTLIHPDDHDALSAALRLPTPLPDRESPGQVISRQRLAAAAADGCPFARFIVDAGLDGDTLERPVRRNGKPY